MKNIIKVLILISMTTVVFAQDVKKVYTPEEQEAIRKSFQEMEESAKKANEAVRKSDESAATAQKTFEEYDGRQKLTKEIEQLQQNFDKVSKKTNGNELNHQVGIVENTKDFTNAYFEFNPYSIFLIIFFAGSLIIGIFKFITNRE